MTSDLSLSRRTLLAALAAGGSPWFLPSLSRAASPPPKRLLVIFSHQGTQRNRWIMRRPGLDETSDWEWPLNDQKESDWSDILRPLYAHRQRMLVIDGLPMMSAMADPRGTNDHFRGWCGSLTGAAIADTGSNLAGGPSFDQVVAAAITRPGQVKSMELAVRSSLPAIWAARGVGLPSQYSVTAAAKRLFAGLPANPGAAPSHEERVRAAQPAVLALTGERFESAARRLSGEDRRKLELHRDLMRDLATQLATPVGQGCTPPALGGGSDYMGLARQMIKLVTAGFSCDITRVMSLQLADSPKDLIGNPPGDLHNQYFHDCEKNIVYPNSSDVMAANCQVHARVISMLLDSLAQVPEAGGTMLENTLVAWFYELASGAHGFGNMAHVLFGNVAGHFRMGRYVRFAPRHEWAPRGGAPVRLGPPHNRLIVSIMRAFGLQQDRIGDASARSANGPVVSLTGPLDRLAVA